MAARERLLDARGLPAPEPLERCLDALADLQRDERLVFLVDREPVPLYPIAERLGFRHECAAAGDHFRVLLWHG